MMKPRTIVVGFFVVLTVLSIFSWYLMERDPVVLSMRMMAEDEHDRALEMLDRATEKNRSWSCLRCPRCRAPSDAGLLWRHGGL